MKDNESRTTIPPHPKRPTGTERRVGNIWLILAAVYQLDLLASLGPDEPPVVLVMDDAGNMHALPQDHPEYLAGFNSLGFVCTFDATTSVERLATNLQAATTRLAQGAPA